MLYCVVAATAYIVFRSSSRNRSSVDESSQQCLAMASAVQEAVLAPFSTV